MGRLSLTGALVMAVAAARCARLMGIQLGVPAASVRLATSSNRRHECTVQSSSTHKFCILDWCMLCLVCTSGVHDLCSVQRRYSPAGSCREICYAPSLLVDGSDEDGTPVVARRLAAPCRRLSVPMERQIEPTAHLSTHPHSRIGARRGSIGLACHNEHHHRRGPDRSSARTLRRS
jgi:hypothetical protein